MTQEKIENIRRNSKKKRITPLKAFVSILIDKVNAKKIVEGSAIVISTIAAVALISSTAGQIQDNADLNDYLAFENNIIQDNTFRQGSKYGYDHTGLAYDMVNNFEKGKEAEGVVKAYILLNDEKVYNEDYRIIDLIIKTCNEKNNTNLTLESAIYEYAREILEPEEVSYDKSINDILASVEEKLIEEQREINESKEESVRGM